MLESTIEVREVEKLSVQEALEKLAATPAGLSSAEAAERLQQFGYNELVEKKVNPVLKFLSYFWGPIPWMIEVAAVLSAVIHHWEDFWIIFILLLLNAVVGFWQEHKADNAIELLKQKLALRARVRRDGQWQELAAQDLVPGDVVRVRLGEIVPADLKLLEGDYLLADESALTGESLPVEKHVGDVAYAGSNLRQGEMDALVTATGMHTYFGKTAKLVEEAKTQSHFQKAVIKIGNYLIVLAVALVVLIFLVAMFRHENLATTLQFALVLTVAAIPVALPPVLSVTMAVGATALAKKEAIVSKLVAIEEMAGMDVLCSDKTGTITKNELTLAEVQPFEGFSEQDVLLGAALASREEDQDPIDTAILVKAKQVLPGAAPISSSRPPSWTSLTLRLSASWKKPTALPRFIRSTSSISWNCCRAKDTSSA
jgi:H+-transporting ATPase